jgi:DNA-binding transcriptional regulator/RsmH inhibitor MraZ
MVEELLTDESAFADYFYTLEQVKPTKDVQDDLLKNNAEIASNASCKPELNVKRAQEIEEIKKRIQKLQEKNAEHRNRLDKLLAEQQKELEVVFN